MVLEEADKRLQRKFQHVRQWHGPDRCAHGHNVVLDEPGAITVLLQVVTQPGVAGNALLLQVANGLAIEAQDIAQHAPEPG